MTHPVGLWGQRYMAQLAGATIEAAGIYEDGTPYLQVAFGPGHNEGLHCRLHIMCDAEGNAPGWIHGIPNPDTAEQEASNRRQHAAHFRDWLRKVEREAMKQLLCLDVRFAAFDVVHTGGGCLALQRELEKGKRWMSISSEANIKLWTDDAKRDGIVVWVDTETGIETIIRDGKEVGHQVEFNDPIAALDYALSLDTSLTS